MNPTQMYTEIGSVRELVDTYSAIVPWGGLEWVCAGKEGVDVVTDDPGLGVRSLILSGRATANVTIGGRTNEVTFEHRELGLFVGSVLAPLSGNADSYVQLSMATRSVPGLVQYLEMLLQGFELQLSLPLWLLNPRVVSTANVVALKTALLHFRFGCDGYRRDISAAIEAAFDGGCRAIWRRELQDGSGITEYAPMYRAFRDAGHDLAPLKTEAIEAVNMLVKAGILPQALLDQVTAKFG